MLANSDRYTKDPDEEAWGVLEIKNVGEYRAEDWADGAIPEYYQVQGMHYMAVTGAQYVWFAPLIGGNRLQPVKLLRSERGIRSLIKIEREFWKLVESRTPPPLDDSEEASKVLKAIYPQSKSTTVFIDSELVEQLRIARERRAEAEREVRGLENKIKELMGEAEAAIVPGNPKPVITWKGSSVHTLDVEAIKQAEPELCMKYMRETSMRRFLVK
jgi:predicted phage-related endonuclease